MSTHIVRSLASDFDLVLATKFEPLGLFPYFGELGESRFLGTLGVLNKVDKLVDFLRYAYCRGTEDSIELAEVGEMA